MIWYVVALIVLSAAGLVWIYLNAPGSTGEMDKDDFDESEWFW